MKQNLSDRVRKPGDGTVRSASCLNSQRVRLAEASRTISGSPGARGCCELGQLGLRSGKAPPGGKPFCQTNPFVARRSAAGSNATVNRQSPIANGQWLAPNPYSGWEAGAIRVEIKPNPTESNQIQPNPTKSNQRSGSRKFAYVRLCSPMFA